MLGGDGGSSLHNLAAVAAIAAASYGTPSRDKPSALGVTSFNLSGLTDNVRQTPSVPTVEGFGLKQLVPIRGRAQFGYLCPYSPSCSKKFRDKTDLTRHIRTHTGESPFACPHCTYRSKQKGSLKVHILKCHGTDVGIESSRGISISENNDIV